MRNGLYRVDFQTERGSGHGVAALHAGIIAGGDHRVRYEGTYCYDEGRFVADVRFAPHDSGSTANSVFGVDEGEVRLEGMLLNDGAALVGVSAQAPSVVFQARLRKLPE